MTIIEFVQEKGWKFVGDCGCANKKGMYRHADDLYKGFEIWIDRNGKSMEIRRRFNPHDRSAKVIGVGADFNYQQVYEMRLPRMETPKAPDEEGS